MLLFILGFLSAQVSSTNLSDQVANQTYDTIVQRTTDTTRIVKINRVLIIGNKKTRDQIISRELTLKPGDTIRINQLSEALLWDKRKIYNLRLFNLVTIRILEMPNDAIDLLVEVQERWYTWPTPILELTDRNFNEWWQNYNHDFGRLNYGIRLDQFNCRGRNETLRFIAQFGFNQRFEMTYTIPYIDKKQKQGLILNIDYSNPSNLAVKTEDHKLVFLSKIESIKISKGISLTYTYRKSFFETHFISMGYRSSQIKDTVSTRNDNYFNNTAIQQQYGTISYSFRSEHRDVVMYPLKGYQFTGLIQKVGLGFEGSVNQWIFNLTYAYHHDLKRGYNLANFSSLYWSDPAQQPYSLYGALGYQRQIVRGYEIYVIEGPKFFVNKTTFKKKIFSRVWRWENMPMEQFRYLPLAIYLKSFVDLGYVENYPFYMDRNLNTRLTNTLLIGGGTGIDIVLPYDVVFRLEYTLTKQGTQGFFFNLKKEF